jgi:hypothetical protein
MFITYKTIMARLYENMTNHPAAYLLEGYFFLITTFFCFANDFGVLPSKELGVDQI